MRAVLLPQGRTFAWSADLDGDGLPEWILEDQKIRAVFSTQDGGRWVELNWKKPMPVLCLPQVRSRAPAPSKSGPTAMRWSSPAKDGSEQSGWRTIS